jgi:short-subunit dehydrogenase
MLSRHGAVLLVGASSTVARALAEEFAREGFELRLAARDLGEARAVAADLQVRFGVRTSAFHFDALAAEPAALLAPCLEGELAGVVVAFGLMHEQREAEARPEWAYETLHVNFTATALVCEAVARALQAQGRGWLCVLSSVAGDRGRQSNYLYGGAKGGLSVYLQGLRHRLAPYGIGVTTIKPGFVDTGMTWGRPGLFAVASPRRAARAIVRSIAKNRSVAYVPGFWRWIMLIIRAIPGPLFERTKL